MKTRDKILEAARQQFNLHGPGNVSVRDICSELSISPGNFNYHFPNKDELVVALYQQMLAETQAVIGAIPGNPMMGGIQATNLSIRFFLDSHREIFKVQERFKFFYLNLFEVLSRHPKVKAMYLSGNELERQAATQLYRVYEAGGVLKKGISPAELSRMVEVGQVLHNSWAVDAEVNYKGNPAEKEKFYLKMCCGLLEPYLMPQALREYQEYFVAM